MAIERERKFLLKNPPLKLPEGRVLWTGYFTKAGTADQPAGAAVRVCISSRGVGKLCIKGPGAEEREEFEYEVPFLEAQRMLQLAPTMLCKIRFEMDGWEIDYFPGQNFWLAEWEEGHKGNGMLPDPLPAWIGEEVTNDVRYTNQYLAWEHGQK